MSRNTVIDIGLLNHQLTFCIRKIFKVKPVENVSADVEETLKYSLSTPLNHFLIIMIELICSEFIRKLFSELQKQGV